MWPTLADQFRLRDCDCDCELEKRASNTSIYQPHKLKQEANYLTPRPPQRKEVPKILPTQSTQSVIPTPKRRERETERHRHRRTQQKKIRATDTSSSSLIYNSQFVRPQITAPNNRRSYFIQINHSQPSLPFRVLNRKSVRCFFLTIHLLCCWWLGDGMGAQKSIHAGKGHIHFQHYMHTYIHSCPFMCTHKHMQHTHTYISLSSLTSASVAFVQQPR